MELNQLIQKACADAAEFGAEFGVKLAFQPGDETLLEEQVLPKIAEMHENGTVNDTAVWNAAVMFGIYLGELMLRQYAAEAGYRWAQPDGNLPVLMKDGRNQMSPITKTHKRLLNGPEDSVESFFRVGRQIAAGGFEKLRADGILRPHEE